MTPTAIIKQAQDDGVTLALSPSGTIKAVGNGEAVNRWLPILREHKTEVVDALRNAELQRLVRVVGTHYAFTDAEHDLALEIALSDPLDALACFRDISARLGMHTERTPTDGGPDE